MPEYQCKCGWKCGATQAVVFDAAVAAHLDSPEHKAKAAKTAKAKPHKK